MRVARRRHEERRECSTRTESQCRCQALLKQAMYNNQTSDALVALALTIPLVSQAQAVGKSRESMDVLYLGDLGSYLGKRNKTSDLTC
jgi:hypothetical protein